ncbi:MAG TPA: quinone-dependent dihydroorotate dehydrogenase [Terrimesophilobacter sp.]|nr:quinone-dependent dihydroorotate dehydrogenase [Terrimesophilobacter sp.]
MYRAIFRLILTRIDPEKAHDLAAWVIRALAATGVGSIVRRWTRPHPSLAVHALGHRFASPFGLAAGFDKNATLVVGLGQLGFCHVEVGTVTALAQPGNPRPRLFRLVADRAVINRMGFNNDGVDFVATRLKKLRDRGKRPVMGVNIGKSRAVALDAAIDDYLASTAITANLADYLVVNVSSPNTPGLRGLQELDQLAPLLSAVKAAAGNTPLLVKIAPDLTDDQVERIASLAVELGLDGIIATNTTVSRKGLRSNAETVAVAGEGGLSGAPLAARSLAVLDIIRTAVPDDFCVISVGGVETAADVYERLQRGATLVQGYTGFLYRGPFWAHSINRGLRRLMKAADTASAVATD